MDALKIDTIFTMTIFGIKIPITETVIVSWVVMLILIAGSIALTMKLRQIPSGPQVLLETAIDFLNNFAKDYFGRFAKYLGPYMGSLFLFLLLANLIPVLSPVPLKVFGHAFIPPFEIRPPTKDINVTAALAIISILLVIVCGFAARGFSGWFKNLLHPVSIMLPFNIMDYGTRILSLSLRLFGYMLGGFVMMNMIEGVLPVALPAVLSLYFDFFDGIMQAGIFVFLTTIYISEAVKIETE